MRVMIHNSACSWGDEWSPHHALLTGTMGHGSHLVTGGMGKAGWPQGATPSPSDANALSMHRINKIRKHACIISRL